MEGCKAGLTSGLLPELVDVDDESAPESALVCLEVSESLVTASEEGGLAIWRTAPGLAPGFAEEMAEAESGTTMAAFSFGVERWPTAYPTAKQTVQSRRRPTPRPSTVPRPRV